MENAKLTGRDLYLAYQAIFPEQFRYPWEELPFTEMKEYNAVAAQLNKQLRDMQRAQDYRTQPLQGA